MGVDTVLIQWYTYFYVDGAAQQINRFTLLTASTVLQARSPGRPYNFYRCRPTRWSLAHSLPFPLPFPLCHPPTLHLF